MRWCHRRVEKSAAPDGETLMHIQQYPASRLRRASPRRARTRRRRRGARMFFRRLSLRTSRVIFWRPLSTVLLSRLGWRSETPRDRARSTAVRVFESTPPRPCARTYAQVYARTGCFGALTTPGFNRAPPVHHSNTFHCRTDYCKLFWFGLCLIAWKQFFFVQHI